MSSLSDHPSTPTLKSLCRSSDYLLTARSALDQLRSKNSKAELLGALRDIAVGLGAGSAYFASVFQSESAPSYRFSLACDPHWLRAYEELAATANDPWLGYAMKHSEPARSSDIPVDTASARRIVALAERHGFRSAAVVPVASTRTRTGALVLGSGVAGFFEDDEFETLALLARSLAMEFHERDLAVMRRNWIDTAQLTDLDLKLLESEWNGQSTKSIAAATGITARAIDMRFYRLNARLASPNRRVSARLAVEHGAI